MKAKRAIRRSRSTRWAIICLTFLAVAAIVAALALAEHSWVIATLETVFVGYWAYALADEVLR